jgi:hypothetical protein
MTSISRIKFNCVNQKKEINALFLSSDLDVSEPHFKNVVLFCFTRRGLIETKRV